ncbi:Transmembrane protein 267 [Blattella germanica]|nr:Transmembrane protein 267 [Blattella germanica]
MYRTIFVTVCIGIVARIGDYATSLDSLSLNARSVTDNLTHGFIAALTWMVVLTRLSKLPLTSRLWEITLCGLLGSAIDLDHFAAAKSFKLQDARMLTSRPFMHCTSLPLAVFIAVSLPAYLYHWTSVQRLLWIMLAAILSHHIRDATRRGFWMWPFGSTPPVPYVYYLLANMSLPHIIATLIMSVGNNMKILPLSEVISM